MTKLICSLFGHTQYRGWWGDGLYGRVNIGVTDGIGRGHHTITKSCGRCGETYILARFHADPLTLKKALYK